MSVAYDATGAGAANGSSPASVNWSHTCTGSDRALVAVVSYGTGGSAYSAYTRTVSCGATPMTSLAAVNSNNNSWGWVELWGLLAPPTGSSTITATASRISDGAHVGSIIGNSVSFVGADSFGTPPTPTYASALSCGITIASATDDYTIAGMCCGAAITSITHDQRALQNLNANSAAGNQVIGTYPGAASVTFTGSRAVSDWWGAVGVSINAATGGGDTGSSLWLWDGDSWEQSQIARMWDGDSWNAMSDPTLL